MEKAELQEALGKKEESEQQLILELEDLRKQLQQAARELLTLKEENSVLWSQKDTFSNEAKEREAGEECDRPEAEWDGGTRRLDPGCMTTGSFQRQKGRSIPGCVISCCMGSAGHRRGHLGRVQHPVALQWSRGSLYSWLTLLMMNCASGEGNAFKTAG